MGGMEQRGGRGGRWLKNHKELFRIGKPPKVITRHPYHTTRPRRHLASNGNSSRATQLVPSIGTILIIVTSQGWQNALQKSRPVHVGQ